MSCVCSLFAVAGLGAAAAHLAVAEEEAAEPVEAVAGSDESAYDNALLVVVGAAGEPEYGEIFDEAQLAWESAAALGNADLTVIDPGTDEAVKAIEEYLENAAKESALPLWIVLIGHGTSGREGASFNLKGRDLKLESLREWLEPFKRPLIIINTSSSSGPFLPALSGPDRIVVTATKSGSELNYASFGAYLAGCLRSPETDLNNDGQNSVYECFYSAARETAAFYEQEGRIATEHPLLDDNGDGKGTSLEALEAYLAGGESAFEVDGGYAKRWSLILSLEERALPAGMRQSRNALEAKVDALKRQRQDLGDDAYYVQLEALLTEIAELYQSVGALPVEGKGSDDAGADAAKDADDVEVEVERAGEGDGSNAGDHSGSGGDGNEDEAPSGNPPVERE